MTEIEISLEIVTVDKLLLIDKITDKGNKILKEYPIFAVRILF